MKNRGKNRRRLMGLAAMLTALLAAGTAAEALTTTVSAPPFMETAAVAAPPALPPVQAGVMPETPFPEQPAEAAPDGAAAPAAPEEPPSPLVPESAAVAEGYFADAVFLGDSRTEGFALYSGLKEGTYLFAVGATVESVFTKNTCETPAGKVPLLDALAAEPCGKVYIMLGINELGWPRAEVFRDQAGKVVDRVRQDHPEAVVVLQSILPVSAKQEAKKSYVNNRRIAEFNAMLQEVAAEKDCPYLNVAEAVTGGDGCLQEELTFDGMHLNTAGCRAWLAYLQTHAVGE